MPVYLPPLPDREHRGQRVRPGTASRHAEPPIPDISICHSKMSQLGTEDVVGESLCQRGRSEGAEAMEAMAQSEGQGKAAHSPFLSSLPGVKRLQGWRSGFKS